MVENPPPGKKATLQKPPGYRDPTAATPTAAGRPAAPRKPPQLPPTLRHPGKPPVSRRRGRSCCCRLCCWFSLILIALIFLLAVAGALAYLWYLPRLPYFRIESLKPSSFNITSRSDGSSSYLDATIVVAFQAANPNHKLGLSYGDLDAWVSVADDDGDVDLGMANVSGFTQGKRNSTVMKFSVSEKGILVDGTVGSRMAAKYKSKELMFGVEVRMKMGLRVGGKSTGRVPIRVECGAVSLKQAGGGGGMLPKCHINVFRWINLH